ncbi:RNA-binding protein 44 [Neosynchiropus ocellatus]
MAGYQTVWPWWCQSSTRNVFGGYPPEYSGISAETRKFLLHRAVFDLVAPYQFLERDDQRLLAWYLHLSSQDRQIILDEGGFQQFLQRHPALELSPRHVHLKQMAAREQDLRRLPVNAPIVGSLNCRVGAQSFQDAHEGVVRVSPNQISSIQDVSHSGLCAHHYGLPGFSGKRSAELEPEYHGFDAVRRDVERLVELEEPEQTKSSGDPLSSSHDSPTTVNENHLGKAQTLTVEDDSGDSGTARCHNNMVDDKSAGASLTIRCRAESTGTKTACVGVSIGEMQKAGPGMSPSGSSSVSSCDAVIRTKHVQFVSVSTQSHAPAAAHKNVVTEVHMRDLDRFIKEFTRLYAAAQARCEREKKWNELNKRVRHAELCVLALQYSMCRQHCWRLFNLSSEGPSLYMLHGATSQYWPQDTPPKVVSVLQKLDSDYREMREQIMAGVPLKDLKALSVDAQMITGTSYIPLPTYQGEQAEKKAATQLAKTSKTSGAGAARNPSHHPGTNQNDNTSEMWFDAVEGFSPTAKDEVLEQSNGDKSGTVEEEPHETVTLCVSNLPLSVTESDVFAMFEKYNVIDVKISAFNNSSRDANVNIRGSHSARKAVAALNGCSVQGHVLHVEEANRPDQGQVLPLSAPSQQQAPSTINRKVTVQPPHDSSWREQRNVPALPAAKGGFIPTRLGTMESLDILMAELKQRHPGVGMERILDAFTELHGKHRLFGMSLETISQMMSDVLTSPANVTPS